MPRLPDAFFPFQQHSALSLFAHQAVQTFGSISDITYPTDLKLLNKAREKSEQIIDELHKARSRGYKKPRTYRQRARKHFLSVAKDKRISRKKMQRCRRQQLGYLRRNLTSIDRLSQRTGLGILGRSRYKELMITS